MLLDQKRIDYKIEFDSEEKSIKIAASKPVKQIKSLL